MSSSSLPYRFTFICADLYDDHYDQCAPLIESMVRDTNYWCDRIIVVPTTPSCLRLAHIVQSQIPEASLVCVEDEEHITADVLEASNRFAYRFPHMNIATIIPSWLSFDQLQCERVCVVASNRQHELSQLVTSLLQLDRDAYVNTTPILTANPSVLEVGCYKRRVRPGYSVFQTRVYDIGSEMRLAECFLCNASTLDDESEMLRRLLDPCARPVTVVVHDDQHVRAICARVLLNNDDDDDDDDDDDTTKGGGVRVMCQQPLYVDLNNSTRVARVLERQPVGQRVLFIATAAQLNVVRHYILTTPHQEDKKTSSSSSLSQQQQPQQQYHNHLLCMQLHSYKPATSSSSSSSTLALIAHTNDTSSPTCVFRAPKTSAIYELVTTSSTYQTIQT